VTTILTGVAVGSVAAIASIDEMVDLTNVGTLFAFALVCAGVPILRWREPQRDRPFRVPFGAWLLPSLGVCSCLALVAYLPPTSWWRFAGWLMLGLGVYAGYGYTRSLVGRELGRPARTTADLRIAAVSFVMLAAAMLTIPHHAGMTALAAATVTEDAPYHARAAAGMGLGGAGALGLVIAWMLGRRRAALA
jgi:APA family basic amino acid/polyamine antiporter